MIYFHPKRGTILICDFSDFKEPEMTKRRPVVVLSEKINGRPGLCTIVSLSTTEPYPIMPYHHKFRIDPPLPPPYNSPIQWVKGDMIYSLSFSRFSLPRFGRNGNGTRKYDIRVLDSKVMNDIEKCVLIGICINT